MILITHEVTGLSLCYVVITPKEILITLIIHIFTRMTIACMKSIGRQVGHVHKYRRALKHNENRYLKALTDASVINLHLILSITLLRTNQNS